MSEFWDWLWSRQPREPEISSEVDRLLRGMRTTAKCRYNASLRLKRVGKAAFLTTTILSLGLVFIPLMQNAAVDLGIKTSVLNMMQIFLAVSVLVYSIVIGTARYEVRAEQLNECGDKLKELIREFRREREAGSVGSERLAEYQQRYSDVVTDVENHSRNDYRLSLLEMTEDYRITGVPRVVMWFHAQLSALCALLLIPMILFGVEGLFVFKICWTLYSE